MKGLNKKQCCKKVLEKNVYTDKVIWNYNLNIKQDWFFESEELCYLKK